MASWLLSGSIPPTHQPATSPLMGLLRNRDL